MMSEGQQAREDGTGVVGMRVGDFLLSVDAFGGKVRGVTPADLERNVLFEPGAPYTLDGERGHRFEVAGWDEACPTVAESAGIPQLGWAWQAQSETGQEPDGLRSTWHLPGMAFERAITAVGSVLTSSYRFQNMGVETMPFLWASHVLYSVDGLIDIDMPATQFIPGPCCLIQEVEAQVEPDDGRARMHDFLDNSLSWKFFVPADGPLDLNFADGTLRVTTTAPWFGVFLNRGRFGSPCLGIEPTTHATDYAADAGQLLPEETTQFSWSLEVIARKGSSRVSSVF